MQHPLSKKASRARLKAIELAKLGRDMYRHFFDVYFLHRLAGGRIRNDLGASFTSAHREGGRMIKTANPKGESKLRDEIGWYLAFGKTPLSSHLPKIYSYSLKRGNVFLEMKYYAYPNLRKIIFNNMNAKFFIRLRLKHILEVFLKHLYVEENSRTAPRDFAKKSHFDKLRNRIRETMQMAPSLRNAITPESLIINGKKHLNLALVIPAIEKDKKIISLLKPDRIYHSHGDLHSNNILCGIMHFDFILVDCRGRSPYGDLYFDPAYDIAKLYHDFHSFYSLIENHQYSISLRQEDKTVSINYHFTNPDVRARFEYWGKYIDSLVKEKFRKFGNIEYRAEFTEAILYLTMVPFHLKKESESLMCYATGIVRLNEWLKKYHKPIYNRLMKEKPWKSK